MFDRWRYENAELIEEHLTSQGKKGKKTNVRTFKHYKPNYVEQTDCLTQFACDNCTDWGFVKSGLEAVAKYIHDCGSKLCENYDESTMEYGCTCDHCKDCLISKYGRLDSYTLFEELCCDIDGAGPNLFCAEGTCLKGSRCGVSKYKNLLLRGIGCHTHKGNIKREVEFRRIVKYKVDDKDYNLVVSDSLPWIEYVFHFINVLQKQITHRYAKRRQNTERAKICSDDNGIILPKSAVFTGIDYIANKKLSLKVVSQGMNTNLAHVSILVLYECRNINDSIAESAHIYLSNQTAHGWYSAIPVLKHYYKRLKTDMEQSEDDFETSIIYSDRGRSDVWCAPFIAYACELANVFGITIQANTTASGEGKWMCDQIGGTASKYIQHAVKVGKIKFGPRDSVAGKIAAHCNEYFSTSKTDSIKRCFYELDVKDVKVHTSPVKSLKIGDGGISNYHCGVITPGNKVSFRKQSCFCTESIESKFDKDCPHTKYCGGWINTKISSYPKYADAVHKPKQKQKRNNKRKRQEKAALPVLEVPALEPPPKKRRVIRVPTNVSNVSNPYSNVPR